MKFLINFPLLKALVLKKIKINSLNVKKVKTHKNIPPKVVQAIVEVTTKTLQQVFKHILRTGEYHSHLKEANTTPFFKRKKTLDEE